MVSWASSSVLRVAAAFTTRFGFALRSRCQALARAHLKERGGPCPGAAQAQTRRWAVLRERALSAPVPVVVHRVRVAALLLPSFWVSVDEAHVFRGLLSCKRGLREHRDRGLELPPRPLPRQPAPRGLGGLQSAVSGLCFCTRPGSRVSRYRPEAGVQFGCTAPACQLRVPQFDSQYQK